MRAVPRQSFPVRPCKKWSVPDAIQTMAAAIEPHCLGMSLGSPSIPPAHPRSEALRRIRGRKFRPRFLVAAGGHAPKDSG